MTLFQDVEPGSGVFAGAEEGHDDVAHDVFVDHDGGATDDGIAQVGFIVQVARRFDGFVSGLSVFVDAVVARIGEADLFFGHEAQLGLQFFGMPDVIGVKKSQKPTLCHFYAQVPRVCNTGMLRFCAIMDSVVLLRMAFDDVYRVVGRGVVDDEQLPMWISLLPHRHESLGDVFLHVVARHDDRYQRLTFHGVRVLFQTFDPNFDLLFVMEATNEEGVVAIGHQIVFQTFYHGFGAFLDVDDCVFVVH